MTKMPFSKRVKTRTVRTENELSAAQMLEDGFNDFYRNRSRVYRVNFIRGIFFGLGSVLGGTIVIAILVAILSGIAKFFPDDIAGFFQWLVDTISRR